MFILISVSKVKNSIFKDCEEKIFVCPKSLLKIFLVQPVSESVKRFIAKIF